MFVRLVYTFKFSILPTLLELSIKIRLTPLSEFKQFSHFSMA